MGEIQTDAALLERLQRAAKRGISSEEMRRQRISFIYGNLPKDSTVTREQIEKALERLQGDKEAS